MYVLKNKRTSSIASKNIEPEAVDDDFDDEIDSDDDGPKIKWFEKVKEFFADFF